MMLPRHLSWLIAIAIASLSCNRAENSSGSNRTRKAVLKNAAFGNPGEAGDDSSRSGTDDTESRNPGDDGDERNKGDDDIVSKPPIFEICWTKADQNNKETVESSPGISYKLYNYNGQVVYNGNTNASAAAQAKADLKSEKTFPIRIPSNSGNFLLAFCDSSKHASCSMPTDVMSTLGGKEKSFGFRNLKNAPAVIGAIPNMRIEGGRLAAADQPFIIYNSYEDPACEAAWSPLVIDMDGKGVTLSSPATGVRFDMNGDGVSDQISWPVRSASMFIALDRNANGNIDSVHELFGNNTVGPDGEKSENGFTALAKYDLNADGKIDAADAVYDQLRLWSDKNRNGLSEDKELIRLADADVAVIDLNYVDTFEVDSYGNQTLQRSTAEIAGKKEGTIFRMILDIWFKI